MRIARLLHFFSFLLGKNAVMCVFTMFVCVCACEMSVFGAINLIPSTENRNANSVRFMNYFLSCRKRNSLCSSKYQLINQLINHRLPIDPSKTRLGIRLRRKKTNHLAVISVAAEEWCDIFLLFDCVRLYEPIQYVEPDPFDVSVSGVLRVYACVCICAILCRF